MPPASPQNQTFEALTLPHDAPLAVISGAQTGIDRGALDAALDTGVPCGGWVPPGRMAEDGVVPDRYPAQEMAHGGYRQRTKANVLDSDGTALIYVHRLPGGTELTLRFCLSKAKPYLLLDASELTVERSAERIRQFIFEHDIRRLNVAGPRETKAEGARDYAYSAIRQVLQALNI